MPDKCLECGRPAGVLAGHKRNCPYHFRNKHQEPDPPMPELVQITPANADERIREAVATLIRCWDEWEGEANQDAQIEQDQEAYFASMTAQIDTVIRGMVFDV